MITLHAILEWTVSQSNNEGTGPGFRLPAKLITNHSQSHLQRIPNQRLPCHYEAIYIVCESLPLIDDNSNFEKIRCGEALNTFCQS